MDRSNPFHPVRVYPFKSLLSVHRLPFMYPCHFIWLIYKDITWIHEGELWGGINGEECIPTRKERLLAGEREGQRRSCLGLHFQKEIMDNFRDRSMQLWYSMSWWKAIELNSCLVIEKKIQYLGGLYSPDFFQKFKSNSFKPYLPSSWKQDCFVFHFKLTMEKCIYNMTLVVKICGESFLLFSDMPEQIDTVYTPSLGQRGN